MSECTYKTSVASVLTAGKLDPVVSGSEKQRSKRVVKLSDKALADKLDRLQADTRFNGNWWKHSDVQKDFDGYIELCDKIRCTHDSILGLLMGLVILILMVVIMMI